MSAVDDQIKHQDDHPSIGVILCKGRNKVVVEYALRDSSKPMGVAQCTLTPAPSLPAKLRRELPTTDDLAGEFELLSIVGLCFEIARALRELLNRHGIALPNRETIASMTKKLQESELMPRGEEFEPAIRVMNLVAHGYDVDTSTAQEALNIGKQYFAEIQRLIDSP